MNLKTCNTESKEKKQPENLENHLQIDRKKCTLYIGTYSCERIGEMRQHT